MAEPWFDPNTFGAWFGSIAGGGLGTLGGLLGAAAGTLAPRGKAKGFIMGTWYVLLAIGAVLLLVGVYAIVAGQLRAIWYGPLLCGVIISAVMGSLLPVIRLRYRQAEQRRIDADGIRMA
jgi:hypothetical protein